MTILDKGAPVSAAKCAVGQNHVCSGAQALDALDLCKHKGSG